MSVTQYPVKKSIPPRVEKFVTQEQIRTRLETLEAMKFEKGQHGIGSRNNEAKLLRQRLAEMQRPELPL